MRLLLAGAFPYPHHQGSQVYLQEQAIALERAGAQVELLTYGRREIWVNDPDRWRALDGFVHHEAPSWATPRGLASGPSLEKPRADLGLALTLRDAIASKYRAGKHYDAILTHHVEACVISAMARALLPDRGPAIVYCPHTLLGNELPKYFKYLNKHDFSIDQSNGTVAMKCLERILRAGGEGLDTLAARSADGWIALTQSSERVMKSRATGPGERIAPPLVDPLPRIERGQVERVLGRHDLLEHGYFLYSGNLDGYQELPILREAAARIEEDAGGGTWPRIVVASHDPRVVTHAGWTGSVRGIQVTSDAEMKALVAGARATLVMRRSEGGFPIKLVNSLACGTPAITFLAEEWGLTDDLDARVADPGRPAASLAEAILELHRDAALARRLGRGARKRFEAAHTPTRVAEATLELLEGVCERRSGGR